MTLPKFDSIKAIIVLLIAMVSLQTGTVIMSVANTINGSNREHRLTKVEDNYMPYELVLNFMDSFGAQLEEAGIYARKDSASFARTSEKYNMLRIQWMRDMRVYMGGARGGETINGSVE